MKSFFTDILPSLIYGVIRSSKFWILMVFFSYIAWFTIDENINVEILSDLPVSLFFLLCSMTFLSFIIRFLRWHILLVLAGHRLPLLWHFNCYLSGLAFTATPGKAGETIRSFFLVSRGVPHADSLGLFICDRFCDLVSLALWCLIFLLVQSLISVVVALSGVLVLIAPIVIVRSRLTGYFFDYCAAKSNRRLMRKLLDLLKRMSEALHFYFNPLRFIWCSGVGMISWSLIGLELKLVLTHYGSGISFVDSMGVTSIGLIAGAASFVPAGLGVNEFVQSRVLEMLSVESDIGHVAIAITRISSLWLAMVVGGVALCLVNWRYKSD
jgi:uncharacterized protein (TIRG00374 family)